MTTSHVQVEAVGPVPAEKRHLRLSAGAEVGHTEAGRFTVPLDLCDGSAGRVPLRLILTAEEALDIHAQLAALLVAIPGGEAK
jgi:hypothetical protein